MTAEEKKIQAWDSEGNWESFYTSFPHNKNEIYLDGNSLGKLPKLTQEKLQEAIQQQWGENLIRSWNDHWLDLPKRISKKLATLLGVQADEIKVGESTSVNLYQIIYALLESGKFPKNLLSDSLNFPTDTYILEGLSKTFNIASPLIVEYPSAIEADIDVLKEKIEKHPGILCLSAVGYKSAWYYPMQELNIFAKKHKSIILWDLSHAIGVVDIDLRETQTQVAIGCTYKFLNGGPGAPAFLYVDKNLQSSLHNPIQGWFGHKNPFAFSLPYVPAEGIQRFEAGTPPVLSMVGIEIGVDLTLVAGIKNIRTKSQKLSAYFVEKVENELMTLGYTLESPLDPCRRGSHITLAHPESWRICKALLKGNNGGLKIIPDFRPPNYIRFGFAPLYTRFVDLYTTVERLKEIVLTEEYKGFDHQKPTVT